MSTPMPPWYTDDAVTVWHGDALDVLADMADNSVDAVVTDPPYGLEFMGKDWDAPWQQGVGLGGNTAGLGKVEMADGATRLRRPSYYGSPNPTCRNCGGLKRGSDTKKSQKPCRCDNPTFDDVIRPRMLAYQQWCQAWAEHCLRVLKPGGHLVAFGGTRTHHRLTCAIEDAGFEIRDSIAWLYGSGFPKSLDVGKAIDRAAGVEREVVGERSYADGHIQRSNGTDLGVMNDDDWAGGTGPRNITAPATDDARRWNGWGTALKPAHEPIVVARKPLAGTVAANVLAWGTGALNIDAGRVDLTDGADLARNNKLGDNGWKNSSGGPNAAAIRAEQGQPPAGRWPPNVALDQATAAALDQQSGASISPGTYERTTTVENHIYGASTERLMHYGHGDSGGASRFFPVFRDQQTCALYGMLSGCERTPSASSTTPANTANGPSATSPATTAAIALEGAPTRSAEWNALAVSSAGMLCASCVTAIARSVAAISLGHSATQALGLPSMGGSSERILTRSLVLIAEDLAKLATTSTTTDLTISLGCAVDAISTYTTRAFRHEQRRSAPSSDLPLWRYEPKAPTLERPRADDAAAHPTVKPLDLMRWLVRLVTPPGGLVLDPFLGSGTTAEACIVEGFRCVGVERESAYLPMIRARLTKPIQPVLDLGEL